MALSVLLAATHLLSSTARDILTERYLPVLFISASDDSQLIEEMLVRKPRTHFRSKPTPAPHDNNGLDKQASSPTELPVAKSQVVNMSEQTRLHLPRVNDQYDSEEAFIRHVKGFAEQSGHKAYQLGGQGKHNCRMLCRNWKKTE